MKRWYSKEDLIKSSQCRYVFVTSPRGYGIVQFYKDLAERRKSK